MAGLSASKQAVPIDVCLFGRNRFCPDSVWEAVLSRGSSTEGNNNPLAKDASAHYNHHNHYNICSPDSPLASNSCNISNSVADISSLSKNNPPAAPATTLMGIDELEKGRWGSASSNNTAAASNFDNYNDFYLEATIPAGPHVISLQELRRIASQGIVDEGSHRPVVWRVLLGYLPLELSDWTATLLQQRQLYRTLVGELFVKPHHDGNDLRGRAGKRNWAQRNHAMMTLQEHHLTDNVYHSPTTTPQQTPKKSTVATDMLQDIPVIELTTDMPPDLSVMNLSETLEDSINSLHPRHSLTPPIQQNGDALQSLTTTASTTATITTQERLQDSTSFDTIVAKPLTRTADEWIANHPHDNPSRSDLIPARIREEWKKSGRDLQVLDQMGVLDQQMNTLLVQNDSAVHSTSTSKRATVSDDPLSTESDSTWFQFFENASLLDEIRKDVVRTHPDLHFFLEPESNLGQRRYAALERILFVWAKLNKGVRYVQGMNEIVGTIYYVLANDMNEMWACEAEADTYFLFNTLMTEMRDVFVPDLDDADTGIQGRISNMTALLSLHDPEVRCHLDDMGIDATFYAIRWLTTLLSREFLLPDTIRLWDSMFASTHKDNFMRYVCVTMVILVRTQLLKGDFSSCLRLLQGYPTTNIDSLLESSRALWIYESQVTLACHKGGMSLHQALTTITPPPSLHMAYGLVGGIATKLQTSDHNVIPSASSSSGSRGSSFLSGAKSLFGGLGREVRPRSSNRRRSANGNG